MAIKDTLTPDERYAVMKYVVETVADDMVKSAKSAQSLGTAAGLVGKGAMGILQAAAALSVVAGVPIGVAWHALDSGSKITRNKERDSLASIRYYNNAAKTIENQLARKGAM
jgi:hypothetical protein